ncbi:MAG: hypothetical protein ACR2KQ_07610 [Actinomycetota bacterium]
MRWPLRLAWALWAIFLIALVGAIYVGLHRPEGPSIGVFDAVWAVSLIGFPTVGVLVVSRFPRRPLGWILCIAPLALMVGVLLSELAGHGIAEPSRGWAWVAWWSELVFPISWSLMVMVPLLLPDGRLPSRRWRPVVWAIGVMGSSMVVSSALRPGYFENHAPLRNPIGVEALGGLVNAVQMIGGFAQALTLVLATLSLPIRFRGASGAERQRLKWLALGGLTILISIGVLALGAISFSNDYVETGLSIVMILALPVSIGLAIRRDRLYDVDLVINKTLVYGALSAILAISYLTIVVLLQRLFGSFIEGSDIAIAASTLAVAALFRPMRSRVQAFIDRRFYRRRYDAARAVSGFSARLRDEIDLGHVMEDLVGVLEATVQPSRVSVWLPERKPAEGSADV